MTTAAVNDLLLPLRLLTPPLPPPPPRPSTTIIKYEDRRQFQPASQLLLSIFNRPSYGSQNRHLFCLSSSSSSSSSARIRFNPLTRLYVSGLSFRTTEDSLRNAFRNFGELIEVTLVMDKIANRPRGFAFIRYATEEESKKAIEGMHGKFLDGRVIFVEVAKTRADLLQESKQKPKEG